MLKKNVKFLVGGIFLFSQLALLYGKVETTAHKNKWFTVVREGDVKNVAELALQKSSSLINVTDEKGRTALMIALDEGHYDLWRWLLDHGADHSLQDLQLQTALHWAAKKDNVDAAAELLLRKADYETRDSNGVTPLDYFPIERLHLVREKYLRAPTIYKNAKPSSEFIAQHVTALKKKGIIKISGLLTQQEIRQLKKDHKTFLSDMEAKIAQEKADFELGFGFLTAGVTTEGDKREINYDPTTKTVLSKDPFKYSEQLVRLCCNEQLLEIVNLYHGKPAYIQYGWAGHHFPGGKVGMTNASSFFSWHHDGYGKEVKMMLLVNDLDKSGRYMSYVLGSHDHIHPYKNFKYRLASTLNYCSTYLDEIKIYDATGKAGDIILFDPNGIHRGNVGKEKGRDTFMVAFTTDKAHMWGCTLPEGLMKKISFRFQNPFERMMSTKLVEPGEMLWSEVVTKPHLWV